MRRGSGTEVTHELSHDLCDISSAKSELLSIYYAVIAVVGSGESGEFV